jgi:hypothetical protein
MADPSLVIGRREVTSVATQALYLMNGKFVMDQARRFADRVIEAESADPAARVAASFRIAYGRAPSAEERKQVLDYVAAVRAGKGDAARTELEAWTDVCHSLLSSYEFLYVD